MKKKVLFILFIVLGIFLLVNTNCKKSSEIEPPPGNGTDPLERLKTLTVTSTAFAYGEKIPQIYTCDGENISPPLHWENVPAGTQSFAVVIFDDSAGFVHMVLFNLQPDITSLPEGISNNLPAGAQFGRNDARGGYFGPCPPPGASNRYYFYVYALDTLLNLNSDTDMLRLMNAMNGHILAWGELLGIYR